MQSDNYEQITLYIRDYFSAMWLLKMEVSLDLVKYVANLGLISLKTPGLQSLPLNTSA
jgi:hypothetical protein